MRLCALLYVLALTTAAPSCVDVTPRDAVLVIDVQNDFLETRPLPTGQQPQFPIPPSQVVNGSILGGSLAVTGSSQILPVVNNWLSLFAHAGGVVLASRDWHPEGHCSFCRNGSAATNPDGYRPHGAVCESGADVPLSVFNSTGRCVDSVSFAAFAAGDYFQWPDHCIQESFGAEFDPFLVVPNASQVVFKGFVPTNDSYSAFGGVQFTTKRELARIIEDMGIQRLFVMGLATDFCVLQSTLDALGKNPSTGRPAPSTLQHVILVEAATRGVTSSGFTKALQVAKSAGAVIVTPTSPADAISDFCNQTVNFF